MKQKRLLDQAGAKALSAGVASVERTRNLCPFAREPGTPALGETLCGAWAGVRWGGRRPGAIRHLRTRRWPGNRVSASGRGNRSERSSCGRRGAGAGENRDAAQGTDLRTVDYPASAGRGKRRQATSTGDESLCFVAFTGGWSWICQAKTKTKPVLYCRRFTHWPVKKSQSQNGFKRRSVRSQRR